MKLTNLELVTTVDQLNRAGKMWPFMLAALPGTVVRVDRTERAWKVVMAEGETFTNLDDAGWLFTGVSQAHDGINRDRTRGRRLSEPIVGPPI